MEKKISNYYQRVIDLIITQYSNEFTEAKPGHCMKITGMGLSELDLLWEKLKSNFPKLLIFILTDEITNAPEKAISATKLIELRNAEKAPLLILIPSNSRTAAEDSYGNATFKEINLEKLEQTLFEELVKKIPLEFSFLIKDIFAYLQKINITHTSQIRYLIALEESGYTKKNIGDYLYYLSLIPDSILLEQSGSIRARLNFNIKSIDLLCTFSKPLSKRINELPIEANSKQIEINQFLKEEAHAKSAGIICKLIAEKYPSLNFALWSIPDLNFDRVKLTVESISSGDMSIIGGRNVVSAQGDKTVKIKIRIRTNPKPQDRQDLKYFKIILMAVDGAAGEVIRELRRFKNSNSKQEYRDATIEIQPNTIEEGSYFFKVHAEDEHGNILNTNDDFKDLSIQKEWERRKKENSEADKSELAFKLTSDSEDFDYVLTEAIEIEDVSRKDKLDNVLQAYFKFRIEKFRNNEEQQMPMPIEESGKWLDSIQGKINATYHIKYSNKHNYQINLPCKFILIEQAFLKHGDTLGKIEASLSTNPSHIGWQSVKFYDSLANQLAPQSLKQLRKQIYELISASAPNQAGIFETFDFFNHAEIIRNYIEKFEEWANALKARFNALSDVNINERAELQKLLTELQNIDVINVQTRLPDRQLLSVKLLSPLHPLRLAWQLNLYDLFSKWESQTVDHNEYKKDWYKNLENIFLGDITPENNLLVLVEAASDQSQAYRHFQYAGELMTGWALYTKPQSVKNNSETLTATNRQTIAYLTKLLNIEKERQIDADISKKLIVKHLKNYLLQHPYTDKLVLNLFNAGDANVFANALVELEKDLVFPSVKYEIRLFKGNDRIIDHGEALKNLLNPEYNVSEEAEAFSQPSANRLFPKLRFSINPIDNFLKNPENYGAHISFLISPFPIKTELFKPKQPKRSFYLNALLTYPVVAVQEEKQEIRWNRYVAGNLLSKPVTVTADLSIKLFDHLQSFAASALAGKSTDSLPATSLTMSEVDKVLLSSVHDHSDWVVTFDRNLGPEVYDLPSQNGETPFLLDYVPGEEILGISSYLTTRPTSEIIGLLEPNLETFGVSYHKEEDKEKIRLLLEDLRAVSSSLILQLNSSRNKAFEVIGAAFTKRVLEKKRILNNAFLIPIDLHQNLFENLPQENKSRADYLLVKILADKRTIECTVIEVKCRKSLTEIDKIELQEKVKEQIDNTVEALRVHFDPNYYFFNDRLDREIKNKELQSLLEFYINRAFRYNYLNEMDYEVYSDYIQTLDGGYSLDFKKLGIIYDFSGQERYIKEVVDNNLTFFIFGAEIIEEILNGESDLNTQRPDKGSKDAQFIEYFGINHQDLTPFLKKFDVNADKFESKNGNNASPLTGSDEDDENAGNNDDGSDGGPGTDSPPIVTSPASASQEKSGNTDYIHAQDKNIVHSDLPLNGNQKENPQVIPLPVQNKVNPPQHDILIGKSSGSDQYGILGRTLQGKKIALDLSETNTISLFGVQGGGKSYTIGTVTEMVLKEFSNINILPGPLASVIFHYSESMDYEPEFTSMIYENDKQTELQKLQAEFGAVPGKIEDIILLTPKDKMEERKQKYPSIEVQPIAFNSKELNVQDWLSLLGAIGNDSTYIKQLKAIMKEHRKNITYESIKDSVEQSSLLSNTQKALALQKLSFAHEYINDHLFLRDTLKPGRLIIVDLRDEFIVKEEALGLFVIMLNIFSGVKNYNGTHFNKFIVFDEAHKYMGDKDLTDTIVTAIREMRHKGVSIMIASQDPPSLPNEIITLSSIVLIHKFNSPQWLKHIQKSITPFELLTAKDLSALSPGEGFIWASKATDNGITTRPLKINTRARVTKHGGATIKAV